jgi:hypothetical protein
MQIDWWFQWSEWINWSKTRPPFYNWRNLHFIHIGFEWDSALEQCEFSVVLLGVGFTVTYSWYRAAREGK